MTTRQWYEYALIELNKVQAPALLLSDFVYFGNKAVGQYINKIYNQYDINQQKTDDLRVLKSTAILTPVLSTDYSATALLDKTFQAYLPDDYLHILNCVVEYSLAKNYQCYITGQKVHFGAKRLTADMYPQLIGNYYMKPKYNNPYFYINNVALDTVYPINEIPQGVITGTILSSATITFGTPGTSSITIVKQGITYTFTYSTSIVGPTTFSTIETLQSKLTTIGITSIINANNLILDNLYAEGVTSITETGTYLTIASVTSNESSLINRISGYRYGNKSRVRMEIRYGKDTSTFLLTKVYIDYIRSPQFLQLTQEQIDEVTDTSQVLEFPDYVCQEILNELIKLIMENASDPRLQTNIPINQSIANPQISGK